MYPEELLDFDRFVEHNQCPVTEQLCDEEAVWFSQRMLLGSRSDMDDIAAAIGRIQAHAGEIKSNI